MHCTCHIFCVCCSACSTAIYVRSYVVYLFTILVSYCGARCRSCVCSKNNSILKIEESSVYAPTPHRDAVADQSHLEHDTSDRSTGFGEARSFDTSLLKEGVSFAQIEVEGALHTHNSRRVHQCMSCLCAVQQLAWSSATVRRFD